MLALELLRGDGPLSWTNGKDLDFEHLEWGSPFTKYLNKSLGNPVSNLLNCDVYEDDNSLFMNIDIPGVHEDSIELFIEGQTLNLKVERKRERQAKENDSESKVHLSERAYGIFERSFTLPKILNLDKLLAHISSGVLRIEIPKLESSRMRKRKIEIQTKKTPSSKLSSVLAADSAKE